MDYKKHLHQLSYLVRSTISVRRLLFNRITITLLIVIFGIALVQGYAAVTGSGTIDGKVVNSNGEPIENANVTLERVDIRVTRTVDSTTTDANGEFSFQNDKIIEFNIVATHEGYESTRYRYHRYYPSQDVEFTIVLEDE